MTDGTLCQYRSGMSNLELGDMRRSQTGEEQSSRPTHVDGRRGSGFYNDLFRNHRLDQRLKLHHITGIAFSGAVGIGIFQTSGEIIALGGPVGALIAFVFAGLVIISVMICLAEIACVRPVTGALMDYPSVFVDEALGFAVGIAYWLGNCMSMVTLTITVAQMSQYWQWNLNTGWIIFAQLAIMLILNGLGVQLYGNLESIFRWLKIFLILAVCIVMIAINAGLGFGAVGRNFRISPGYSPTGFLGSPTSPKVVSGRVPIMGVGGQILAIWTCTTTAMFQFMGGEIALVPAGEAKSPRKDLPIAARYMYLLPVCSYLITILLVGLCVNYLDPKLYHPYVSNGTYSGSSPIVIAVNDAGFSWLSGVFNGCFIFSALTAANSALYVSSRTLFVLATASKYPIIRRTIGRTNMGHTPLAAIAVSFIPGLLAFLGVKAEKEGFRELIHVLGRFYTGAIFCVYGSECLSFLRFRAGMKLYKAVINRDDPHYGYRAHKQPMWAYFGLLSSFLLMFFSGWSAIFNLSAKTKSISTRDSIVDLVASYSGPVVFMVSYIAYKIKYQTRIVPYERFGGLWFPADVPDEPLDETIGNTDKSKFRRFLSLIIYS